MPQPIKQNKSTPHPYIKDSLSIPFTLPLTSKVAASTFSKATTQDRSIAQPHRKLSDNSYLSEALQFARNIANSYRKPVDHLSPFNPMRVK